MAEYYPLLARAVAALPDAAPDGRRKIYERARQALIGQLRKIDPPVPEADIERETQALDDAVARLEAELNAKAGATAPVAKPAAAPPAPSARMPGVQAPISPAKPLQPLRPFVPPRPPPDLSAAGPDETQWRHKGPATPPPVTPARREPGQGAKLPPPVRTPDLKATPPDLGAASNWQPAVEPPRSEKDRLSGSDAGSSPAQAKADWRGFGRPRHDRSAKPENTAAATDDVNPAVETSKFAHGRGEAMRPAAPQAETPHTGSFRHWIVGSIVAVVVIVVAAMAFLLKDNPDELARRMQLAAPPPETGQGSGKIVDRVGGTPAQQAAASATKTAGQSPQSSTDTQQQSGDVIPVAQRAALLVEAPDQPQQVKTYVGTVVWRRENVNHGQDQTLSLAVRADIELPEAKLKATIIFQKNTDATLPASHTIEVRFMPEDGSLIPGVKQIDVPQLRKQDSPAGDPLTGVPAPITQNYFLVGLTQGDAAAARNIDLIKSRQWFDIPMLLTDNKIAKMTFEKGDPGDRALNEAFAAWQ